MRTSVGKIGRLSVELRRDVNKMIRDNKTANTIIKFLEQNAVKNISPQNVSSWKANGYQQWLRRQNRIDSYQANREFARDMVERAAESGDEALSLTSNAASEIAINTILDVLEDFDPSTLTELLAEKPEKFMGLVDSIAQLRKGDQAFVNLKMKFEEYRGTVRDKAQRILALAGDDTATADDIKAIAKEMYGV